MPNKEDWLSAIRSIDKRVKADDRFGLKSPQFTVAGWCICAEHQRKFKSVVLRWAERTKHPDRQGPFTGARECTASEYERKGWRYRVDLAPSELGKFVKEEVDP